MKDLCLLSLMFSTLDTVPFDILPRLYSSGAFSLMYFVSNSFVQISCGYPRSDGLVHAVFMMKDLPSLPTVLFFLLPDRPLSCWCAVPLQLYSLLFLRHPWGLSRLCHTPSFRIFLTWRSSQGIISVSDSALYAVWFFQTANWIELLSMIFGMLIMETMYYISTTWMPSFLHLFCSTLSKVAKGTFLEYAS